MSKTVDYADVEQVIYHLVRMGAKGDSQSAKDVGMFGVMMVRALKRQGQTERAENIENALTASGYAPDPRGFLRHNNSFEEAPDAA